MADAGFGIYVHWPFCLHKCPYCDFNSHVTKTIDYHAWRDAYLSAIAVQGDYRKAEKLTSVYFGGGTPSTCPPFVIEEILNSISKNWDLSDAEITIEANPTSAEKESFRAYSEAGINRISIGFQAFNDDELKRLGRMHSVEESLQALEIANKYFPRSNFDVIYARQDQSVSAWENELNQLLSLSPSHISLYQLTIEAGTRFGDMYEKGKLLGLPNEDVAHEMYVLTRDRMRANGFEHYEVSNFAKAGEQSRHNLIYWNYGDYLGIGPGAHGRLWRDGKRVATTQAPLPKEWLANPSKVHEDVLTQTEAAEEYVILGLRIEDGIEFARLDEMGVSLPSENTAELIEQGLIVQDNNGIRATDEGRLVLNHVIGRLLT